MKTPRELALELALVSAIADYAKERKDYLRAEMIGVLDEVGADSAAATLPDGTKIAKVGIVAPKARVSVIDERSFTEHVKANRPDEIVERVRESYRKFYLESLVATDDGSAVDPQTGEIVSGVVFSDATRYPSLRFEKDGRENLGDALSRGVVFLPWLGQPQTKELEA